ncbi:MAG: hypothetical protein GY696_19140 [Gammaproteobacteria bacterium]|nr:hypothetical protein [Gammaproteobacteria bacterium]
MKKLPQPDLCFVSGRPPKRKVATFPMLPPATHRNSRIKHISNNPSQGIPRQNTAFTLAAVRQLPVAVRGLAVQAALDPPADTTAGHVVTPVERGVRGVTVAPREKI